MIACRGRVVLPALLLLASPAGAATAVDYADCEALLAKAPLGEKSAACLYEVGRGTGPARAAAARRLEELEQAEPGQPWPVLYLGYLRWVNGKREEAEGLYRRAIEASVVRGMPRAELLARSALARILRDTGRMEEAGDEVKRAVAIADRFREPFIQARAGILQANHWIALGDLERAYVVLAGIERTVKEDASYPLTRDFLFALYNVTQQTGRFHEAAQRGQRLADLAAAHGDVASEAMARFGLARVRLDELSEMPEAAGRTEVFELARRSLAAARAARRPALEASSLWVLGSLTQGAEAVGYLERCYAVADTVKMRSHCRGTLARRLARSDPAAAESAIHEALSLAQQAGDIWARTSSWHERMRVSWETRSPEVALRHSFEALDAIEALRDLQEGSARQPGLFSTWAEDYYWLSGRLLRERRVEQGFKVIERMRSRTLIDALGISRQAPETAELRAVRAGLFVDIARVQRRLLEPGLGPREKAASLDELRQLELREEDLRARIARADPARSELLRSDPLSFDKIRDALADDEALLSFQIAPWEHVSGDFGGGSWLLASTRGATRVYRLPDRVELRTPISLFTGMFEARDGSEARGAALLYEKLLARALAELPQGIRRLAIIPDDSLHRLPFAALRPGPASAPLAARYEISLAPSATLWLRWREARPVPAVAPALVLADPVTLVTRGAAAGERSASFLTPARLGRLPYARTEGESVVKHLGGGELLVGQDASESYVKEHGAGSHGIVHFAAHAVTDELNPDRSGIYLSPGGDQEDGLLQVREIAELALDTRIVVLSSCESASGEILLGEGVMGLARAFFQAGAHTVVASLWPLRDDDGAALFDRFYHHLGRGRSVAAALRSAQLDRIEAGAPAEAWAGVVVLGDGGRVPVPGGRGPGWAPWTAVALLSLIALLLWRGAGGPSRRSGR